MAMANREENSKIKLLFGNNNSVTNYLINAVGRGNAIYLLLIVGVMSILDLLGIAIIFPFLEIIIQPDLGAEVVAKLGFNINGLLTNTQLIVILGCGLILAYICKTLIQAALLRAQAKYLARFTAKTTNEVISHVLSARYALFQGTAASEIAGTAYSNTVHATLALTAMVQGANEALVLSLLFLGFLFFQPMLSLAAVLLVVIAGLLLFQIVIRRSAQLGAAQSQIENVRYRLLFSIASAIRDINIMGLAGLFDKRNRHVSKDYAELAWRYNYNAALPRLLIELIALLAIVGASLTVAVLNIPLDTAGPLLGLIAVATVRAVPAFTRLFGALSTFRSSSSFVKRLMVLQKQLEEAAVIRTEDGLSFKNVIELKNIGFSYGGKQVLTDVCIHLGKGESIGIVGSSGAGKTTLLDLFTGLQPATSGQFYCDGVRFDPFRSLGIHKLIGYVPQTITLLDETIAFNVSFDEQPDIEKVQRALDIANLHRLIESLPDGMQTRVGENGLRLSGGQRQRIGIARALYRSPEVLVFDEATSSLDTLSEAELTAEIEKLRGQVSVVIVAHRLSTVMACDRIYVLANGVVESSGAHSALLRNSEIYQRLYSSQNAIQNT